MSGISQAEFDHLAEENDELHKRISQLERAEEEFQRAFHKLEDEKEVLAKKSKEQEKKLEETEQKLEQTEAKLHETEDLLHEANEDRDQGEDDPEILSKLQSSLAHVRAAANRRNSREGRRKTSIMMGQDEEIEKFQAKIYEMEDQLKVAQDESDKLKDLKDMIEKLQQDRREDQAEHSRVKEELGDQIKHWEDEHKKLREKNIGLLNEMAALREDMEMQTGNANLGADESSGTGDTTPVTNLHRSSLFLSHELNNLLNEPSEVGESHAASEASGASTEKEELRERITQAEKETELLKEAAAVARDDHEVTKTELSQVLKQKRSTEEELLVKLEELKRLSASHQQLQAKCDSQRMELGRLQSDCAKHLARATSAERHPVQMNIVPPSITSPFFKLSAKISTLQQQLERAKHSENELRSQVLK